MDSPTRTLNYEDYVKYEIIIGIQGFNDAFRSVMVRVTDVNEGPVLQQNKEGYVDENLGIGAKTIRGNGNTNSVDFGSQYIVIDPDLYTKFIHNFEYRTSLLGQILL